MVLKDQKFGGHDIGGSPKPGTSDFNCTKVLPDILIRSNFECNAFSDLEVDSMGRKKKYEKQIPKQEK